MGHFRSNIRDLQFNLFEVLKVDRSLGQGPWEDLDEQTVRDMLREVSLLAEGPLADSFTETDRTPPVFDPATHSVALPETFKKSFRLMWEGGWNYLGVDPELGGVQVPKVVQWSINELILGAQPAAFMYASGPTSAQIFFRQGTDEQKRWAIFMARRGWGSTMVLTEPEAGSDVGAGRTKAVAQDDGSWHIEGIKRFITSAASDDLFENIGHFVLARPEGAGPGTKGLSLFFVPQLMFDPGTGEPLTRNGVRVTAVEHKMGLKASATCEVAFGVHDLPAKGWLVGEVHNGIAQMFDVIEHARMFVGTKAIATLSTGYLNALDYAKSRVQGTDMARLADKSAPKVTIVHHPDVRRSLMMQKAYAEGLRAVYLYTAAHQDAALAQQVSGADPDTARRVNDLLLPIVKGAGSERAYQYLIESLQTLGGSGYLQDHPIEQYVRDAKIDSLYEGTTAIQAQDFFFRKIIKDQGVALAYLSSQIELFVNREDSHPRLREGCEKLRTALGDAQAMTGLMTEHLIAAQEDPAQLYKIGLGSVRYLLAMGDLLIGWQLLVQAEVALTNLAVPRDDGDKYFYEGKVSVASFFAKSILPELSAARRSLASVDLDIMSVAEGAL